MNKLQRSDLYSLEDYAGTRGKFRSRVIAHKKNRRVRVGEHVLLHFEDRLTMHYQVQEMLRVEKIFDADGIAEELDTYNPLIPDGGNWKATMMVVYPDPEIRRARLAVLVGIDAKTWVQVSGRDRVYAISNEDLEREAPDKTSSVHFLRFELTPPMIADVKAGAAIAAGISHDNYTAETTLPGAVRSSLADDLD